MTRPLATIPIPWQPFRLSFVFHPRDVDGRSARGRFLSGLGYLATVDSERNSRFSWWGTNYHVQPSFLPRPCAGCCEHAAPRGQPTAFIVCDRHRRGSLHNHPQPALARPHLRGDDAAACARNPGPRTAPLWPGRSITHRSIRRSLQGSPIPDSPR